MPTYYKVLDQDGQAYHGGTGQWHLPRGKRPGKWMPEIQTLIPCQLGYHLCRLKDLPQWIGPRIFVAEGRGQQIIHQNKVVYAQARLLYETAWSRRAAVRFACDCAEHILPVLKQYDSLPTSCPPLADTTYLQQVIEATRQFLNGEGSQRTLSALARAVHIGEQLDVVPTMIAYAVVVAAQSAIDPTEIPWAGFYARDAVDSPAVEMRWQARRLHQYLKGTK